ncbi:MAG: decarboxylase [Acidimicrobiales bacterium]|nr:decarboxylase [Acidimicrobiales bacterium]
MAPPLLTADAVSMLDRDRFVHTFGAVYESSPQLAAAAYARCPFAARADVIAAFDEAAAALDDEAALALLRVHPVLGATGPMAKASQDEQASAGLSEIESGRRERLRIDNARYLEKFGFPFIIAVRGLTVDDIDAALTTRLENSAATERATAMIEVRRIAALRIEQLVAP